MDSETAEVSCLDHLGHGPFRHWHRTHDQTSKPMVPSSAASSVPGFTLALLCSVELVLPLPCGPRGAE